MRASGQANFVRLALLLALGFGAWFFTLREAPTRPVEPGGARILYTPSPEALRADPDLIGQAKHKVDMAAYVLTDRTIIAALAAAGRRGVKVRIYLDRAFTTRGQSKSEDAFADLAATPNVTLRFKSREAGMMHLKSYSVDDRLLRTGSANFSYSGGRFQDNDVVIFDSPAQAAVFGALFEKMWARADNEDYRK